MNSHHTIPMSFLDAHYEPIGEVTFETDKRRPVDDLILRVIGSKFGAGHIVSWLKIDHEYHKIDQPVPTLGNERIIFEIRLTGDPA